MPCQPVMRQADRRRTRCVLGFESGEPAQLGDGERCDGYRADCGRPDLRARRGIAISELRYQRLGVGRRPRVVPQQSRSDDVTRRVETHHPVLLRCYRQPSDVVESACFAQRGSEGCRPCRRIYLGTVRVNGAAFAHQSAGLGVTNDDLARLRRGIDPGNERHDLHRQISARRARARPQAGRVG